MKLRFEYERLLAVTAHPDDAELLCAGTLARAQQDGAAIGVCVLCRGDKGQPLEAIDDLAGVRRAEMAAAAKLLGAVLLEAGQGDGELDDSVEQRRVVVEQFRQFRPTLVLAHAPHDYHPDHRAAGRLAEAASWFAASAGHVTASPPLDRPPVLWWMDTIDMHDFEPAFYVDVSEFVELKRRMLRCHASQMARGAGAGFAPLDDVMTRQCRARGAQAGVAAAEAFRPCAQWKRRGAW